MRGPENWLKDGSVMSQRTRRPKWTYALILLVLELLPGELAT